MEGNKITLTKVKICDFAVELKVSEYPQHHERETTFRDEVKRHSERLESAPRGKDIDISHLIDEDNRVTFIIGIAGMGKSVLARQLAIGWSNGDMYSDFELCIFFECRDLNYFMRNEGAEFKKHKVFEEFIKAKWSYDFGDGRGILFVVDGLDELSDIYENESVIGQLLSKKYALSKIIMTGRPYIEEQLKQHSKDIDMRKVEIQGLNDNHINQYINKIRSFQANSSYIVTARASSEGNLTILHVPQFLNTFCCVAILMGGHAIRNRAELYSWTIYLLLSQHDANKLGLHEQRIPTLFNEYAKLLLKVSEICHTMLSENRIIFEGPIEPIDTDTKTGENFLKSLFVDASDNLTERHQFKHLSLMEFFAALHICSNSINYKKSIKANLKKGFVEIVSFACRLIAGFSYRGIIKELLEKVSRLKKIDSTTFLKDVITVLNEPELHEVLDEATRFERSVEFISYFIYKDFKEKDVVLALMAQLHGHFDALGDKGYDETLNNIMDICTHLIEVCECNINDIRLALKHIHIDLLKVSNGLNSLSILKYLDFQGMSLYGIKSSVNALRRALNESFQYGRVNIVEVNNCTFEDEDCIRQEEECSSSLEFDHLYISHCDMNRSNFIGAGELGIVSRYFFLSCDGIENNCLGSLVELIKTSKANGELKMKGLVIDSDKEELTDEMQLKVRRINNVKLFILLFHNYNVFNIGTHGIIVVLICKVY